MAILLILLSVFALWGFGSGSSGVTTGPTAHVPPRVVKENSQRTKITCKKARIKGASGQPTRCTYLPVKP